MSRELDSRVARALGYTVYHYDKDHAENCYYMLMDAEFVPVNFIDGSRKTEAEAWSDAPRFSSDLAAAQSLEAVVAERGLQEKYADCLMEIISEELYYNHLGRGLDSFEVWTVATATAEQRVRAFLATIEAFAASGRRAT